MINIAIDGPAGAGKSTIAKMLAKDLDILYLDTGAMYRAVAYYILTKGISLEDDSKINDVLPDLKIDIKYIQDEQYVFINNKDVTAFIRENSISMAASTISKNPQVRLKLVELQRDIAGKTDCVLDGRDIGSFVLPYANLKIYLTASSEVRAKRRYDELILKNKPESYEKLLKEIIARDYQDANRDFAPLVVAKGAVVIDTSNMTIQEVAFKIKKLCKL